MFILALFFQARTLRALQYYPAPELPAERTMLNEMLQVWKGADAGVMQRRALNFHLCFPHCLPLSPGHHRQPYVGCGRRCLWKAFQPE
jgi:hypothetical protein